MVKDILALYDVCGGYTEENEQNFAKEYKRDSYIARNVSDRQYGQFSQKQAGIENGVRFQACLVIHCM